MDLDTEAAIRADERKRRAAFLEETVPLLRALELMSALKGIVQVTQGHADDLRKWDGVLMLEEPSGEALQ